MSHKNSCLPRRRSGCLGHVCGPSIDLDDVRFSAKKSNLVYMDKVFSYNDATGCPLIVPISTGGPHEHCFKTSLTLSQNGCNCSTCTLDSNAVFTIEESFVLVESFETATGTCIHRNQVTVDGFPVDSIVQMGGQYLAETTDLIPRIQKERCLEQGLPTKTFFLISGAGPWRIRTKFIILGKVNTAGKTCCFRLEIENSPNAPAMNLPADRLSNFAVSDLSLPCTVKGIAPLIRFQFDAAAQLQNPILHVNCHREGSGEPGGTCSNCVCNVTLCGNMVVEPTVQVEVIRKTLFCVEACEALLPCQGTFEDLLSESEEECPDPFETPCRCGTGVLGIVTSDGCGCDNDRDDNRRIAGDRFDCDHNHISGDRFDCGCGNVGGNSTTCGTGCGCGCGDHNHDHNHNPGVEPRRISGFNGNSW